MSGLGSLKACVSSLGALVMRMITARDNAPVAFRGLLGEEGVEKAAWLLEETGADVKGIVWRVYDLLGAYRAKLAGFALPREAFYLCATQQGELHLLCPDFKLVLLDSEGQVKEEVLLEKLTVSEFMETLFGLASTIRSYLKSVLRSQP